MSDFALNNNLNGGSVGFYGGENSPSSKENLTNTIAKLEKERDKFKQARELTNSDVINKRVNNLENRISNLQKRLDKLKAEEDNGECRTCKNRRYQDESDDPGVSFKSASKVAKGAAGAAVRGHEQEHVVRERAKAEREGREVVSQNVVIKTAICPECGDSYVAGGETTTVTRSKPDTDQPDKVGKVGELGEPNDPYKLNDPDKSSEPNELAKRFDVGNYDREVEKGQFFDTVA